MLFRSYVALSADGLLIGGGVGGLMPDQLRRYRTAVDNEVTGSDLARIIATLRRARAAVPVSIPKAASNTKRARPSTTAGAMRPKTNCRRLKPP